MVVVPSQTIASEINHRHLGLRHISDEELTLFRELLDHVGRMLTRLLKRLEA